MIWKILEFVVYLKLLHTKTMFFEGALLTCYKNEDSGFGKQFLFLGAASGITNIYIHLGQGIQEWT